MVRSVLGRHPPLPDKIQRSISKQRRPNLSDEYRSKIADIQAEISTVREYVGLYEHAPQMKAADVSDCRRRLGALGRLLAEL